MAWSGAYPIPSSPALPAHACAMTRLNPVIPLVVPPPSRPNTPTIVGGVLFGSIFILLIAGCLYYANACRGEAPSSPRSGSRGDFFRNLRGFRFAFVSGPVASSLPLNARTDNTLRTLNFSSPPADLHLRNARPQLTIPPPYGHSYEHPPSYEASVSDHGSTSYSPTSPSTPGSAAEERSTVGRAL